MSDHARRMLRVIFDVLGVLCALAGLFLLVKLRWEAVAFMIVGILFAFLSGWVRPYDPSQQRGSPNDG